MNTKFIIIKYVLNCRDQHEKHGIALFHAFGFITHHLMIQKPAKIHWLHYDNYIPSLNTVKILRNCAVSREL